MKKILLGTTAIVGLSLVAGQAFAAGPEVSLSGFAKFEMEFNTQDDTTGTGGAYNRGYNFEVDDFELDWKAKAVADNGLEYGAKLEFQFGRDSDDKTDESMIWLSGNWGLINLGDEDGAEDLMAVAGYSVIGGVGAWDGEGTSAFTAPSAISYLITSAMGGDTGDATKVTYFTPSFSGFRAGVSLTPDSGQRANEALSDEDTDMANNIAIAAEYKGTFSDVGVHGSVRYVTAEYESNDTDTTTAKNDVSAWALGAKVTYQGFALAGSYNDNGDSGVRKVDEALGFDAGSWYDVALSYSTGPYKVGAGYMHSEKQYSATATSEVDYFAVTGGWNVAPGLDFYAEYDYVDMDDGTTATANDNEASVFIVGTKVSF